MRRAVRSLDQLWDVEVGKGVRRRRAAVTAGDLQDLVRRQLGVRVPRGGPVPLSKAYALPVSPYLLGLLLGDGALSSNHSVVLWTNEPELQRAAREALPEDARFSDRPAVQATTTGWAIVGTGRRGGSNPVLSALRELGLAGKLAHQKFVPECYLWAPVHDRLALLQGLLDTDGAADPAGQVTYSTASPQLAQDVVHLVQSLGGRCSLHMRTGITFTSPTQRTPKAARDSYKVGGIRLLNLPPFRLTRKADRVRPVVKTPLWSVRSVELAGVEDVGTLVVDGSGGLLLAKHFIPTLTRPAELALTATTAAGTAAAA